MGLFDDLNHNFQYTKKYTYEDIMKALEDILTEGEQNDTDN